VATHPLTGADARALLFASDWNLDEVRVFAYQAQKRLQVHTWHASCEVDARAFQAAEDGERRVNIAHFMSQLEDSGIRIEVQSLWSCHDSHSGMQR
jgi:hypothetical protein